MEGLTTELLARACRIFLTLAYPGGAETIPENRRHFYDLTTAEPIEHFLVSAAPEICQPLPMEKGAFRGYALRLGSTTFPHLKLQVTLHPEGGQIVFGVDTHDAFPRSGTLACEGHPDHIAWTRLQQANKQLKERIESAWEQADLITFNRLLREGL
jgi:hypothetical protein